MQDLRVPYGKVRVKCPVCGEHRLLSKSTLRSRAGRAPYCCPKCGRRKVYERTRVVCPECPECGSKDTRRNGHSRHGMQNYRCRGCGAVFPESRPVFEHVACPYCGSNRTQRSGMVREDRHVTRRRFCVECRRYFRDAYLPERWALDHDACTECGRTVFPHQSRGMCRECSNAHFRKTNSTYFSEWKKNNRAKVQHYGHKRRLLMRSEDSMSTREYEQFVAQMKECVVCGATTNLTVDHNTPINRLGPHTKPNLVCLCRTCNLKKHTKTLDEFLAWLHAAGMPVARHPREEERDAA